MYKDWTVKPPIFEVGFKAYLWGKKALDFSKTADKISKKYDVPIVIDPQPVDIPAIAQNTDLQVFAQHIDPIEPGRGQGHILAEAVKEAGAVGVMLNHVECRLSLSDLNMAIKRADEAGLATIICTDTPEEAAAVASLSPNVIVAEPPSLIATKTSVAKMQKDFVTRAVTMIKKVNPRIIVASGAGMCTGDDVTEIIRLGVEMTGSSSGVLRAEDPVKKLDEMVKAIKLAWSNKHS